MRHHCGQANAIVCLFVGTAISTGATNGLSGWLGCRVCSTSISYQIIYLTGRGITVANIVLLLHTHSLDHLSGITVANSVVLLFL